MVDVKILTSNHMLVFYVLIDNATSQDTITTRSVYDNIVSGVVPGFYVSFIPYTG